MAMPPPCTCECADKIEVTDSTTQSCALPPLKPPPTLKAESRPCPPPSSALVEWEAKNCKRLDRLGCDAAGELAKKLSPAPGSRLQPRAQGGVIDALARRCAAKDRWLRAGAFRGSCLISHRLRSLGWGPNTRGLHARSKALTFHSDGLPTHTHTHIHHSTATYRAGSITAPELIQVGKGVGRDRPKFALSGQVWRASGRMRPTPPELGRGRSVVDLKLVESRPNSQPRWADILPNLVDAYGHCGQAGRTPANFAKSRQACSGMDRLGTVSAEFGPTIADVGPEWTTLAQVDHIYIVTQEASLAPSRKVVQIWSESRCVWSSGHSWPIWGQSWPMPGHMWSTFGDWPNQGHVDRFQAKLGGPRLSESGQTRLKFGRFRATFVRDRAAFGRFRANRATLCPSRPTLARFWATRARNWPKLGPFLTNLGQESAKIPAGEIAQPSFRNRPKSGRIRPTFGRNLRMVGRNRSNWPKPCQVSRNCVQPWSNQAQSA